jgi:hypothetical protein
MHANPCPRRPKKASFLELKPVSVPDDHEETIRRWPRRLNNLGAIRREMATLYGESRDGKIDTLDASRVASILSTLGKLIEGSELEQRMAEIEARLDQGKRRPTPAGHPNAQPNGHGLRQ